MSATTARLPTQEILARLEAHFSPCDLCELRCGAARALGERGACGLDDKVHVYNRLLHMGEEGPLVPSYAVFLSGCSMACSFCSEDHHLRAPFAARAADPEDLAERIARALRDAPIPAKNINFVGGEPGIALPWIARVALALERRMPRRPPLLLNTNGYLTPDALALASQLCEIFVVDFKFGNDRCAQSIANTAAYGEVLRRNLAWLARPALAPTTLAAPVLAPRLWVRHLLMPDHLECCAAPCLAWLAEHAPDARVNVMPAFHPFGGEQNAPWRALRDDERAQGRALLAAAGLRRPYFDGRRLEG